MEKLLGEVLLAQTKHTHNYENELLHKIIDQIQQRKGEDVIIFRIDNDKKQKIFILRSILDIFGPHMNIYALSCDKPDEHGFFPWIQIETDYFFKRKALSGKIKVINLDTNLFAMKMKSREFGSFWTGLPVATCMPYLR